jgi:predicted dehydrogenase
VHRKAAALDGGVQFVAGCLSSTPEKAAASGRELGLPDDRNYPNWRAMVERERLRPRYERVDFVTIVTPNDTHYQIARAFVDAGIHVVIDKPMSRTSVEAAELTAAVKKANVVCAVTYNYSGYPMVRQARHMVRQGAIGPVRKVVVRYSQGWLASAVEKQGQKQAAWRTDPARAGAGAIADIGTHAENLLSFITGLRVSEVCADLATFVPARKVEDDASVLLRLKEPGAPAGGVRARGVLTACQVAAGHDNDLSIDVHGEKGSLSWRQEEPETLVNRTDGQAVQVLRRGQAGLCDAAKSASRLPGGHPEGFIEALANVYTAVGRAIHADAGGAAPAEHDFPGVDDGERGVRFVEAVLKSAAGEAKWTAV